MISSQSPLRLEHSVVGQACEELENVIAGRFGIDLELRCDRIDDLVDRVLAVQQRVDRDADRIQDLDLRPARNHDHATFVSNSPEGVVPPLRMDGYRQLELAQGKTSPQNARP